MTYTDNCYTCHTCKTVHTEGNMVAHCATCFSKAKPVMPSSLVVAEALAAAEADGRPWMPSVILAAALLSSQAKLTLAQDALQDKADWAKNMRQSYEDELDSLKARLESAERVVAAARDVRNVIGKTFTRIGERADSINSLFKMLTAHEKGE